MKKFIAFVLFLCMGIGTYAAVVSGKVTFLYYGNPQPVSSGTVTLTKDGAVYASATVISAYPDATYEIKDVLPGQYTVSFAGLGYGAAKSFTGILVVPEDETEVTYDIAAVDEFGHIFMTLTTYVEGTYRNVDSVRVRCVRGKDTVEAYTRNGSVTFYCDTMATYRILMSKKGYKDTAFDQVTGKTQLYVSVYLSEDLGEMVAVEGSASLEDGSPVDLLTVAKLAVLSSRDKEYSSAVIDGKYSFPAVSVGPARFYMIDNAGKESRNYVLTEETRTADLQKVQEGEAFLHDVVLVRTGVTVEGVVAKKVNGQAFASASVWVDDQAPVVSAYDGKFSIDGIEEGSHTVYATAAGTDTVSFPAEVSFEGLGLNASFKLADTLKLSYQETDLIFYGTLSYYASDYSTVYVQGAAVEIWNQDETELLGRDTTDESGNFELVVRGMIGNNYNVKVSHPSINPASVSVTAYTDRNSVYVYITEKTPELYPVVDAKAEKIKDSLAVRLSWDYPQELKDGYWRSDGSGVYMISRLTISKREPESQYGSIVKILMPDCDTCLPARSCVDTAVEEGKTYFYMFEIMYAKPSGTMATSYNDSIMVELKPDETYYRLTLNALPEEGGRVEGAGEYEEGSEAEISAEANRGYVFKAWISGTDTLSREAVCRIVVLSDTAVTALFEEEEPEARMFELRLAASPEEGGRVEGAGKYEEGSEAEISAEANSGYRFLGWKAGDAWIGEDAVMKVVVVSDSSLVAYFEKETGNRESLSDEWEVFSKDGALVIGDFSSTARYFVYDVKGLLRAELTTGKSRYRTVRLDMSGIVIVKRVDGREVSVRKVLLW